MCGGVGGGEGGGEGKRGGEGGGVCPGVCVEELEGNELDIANFEHLVVDNREGIGRDRHGGQCRCSRCWERWVKCEMSG